MRENK